MRPRQSLCPPARNKSYLLPSLTVPALSPQLLWQLQLPFLHLSPCDSLPQPKAHHLEGLGSREAPRLPNPSRTSPTLQTLHLSSGIVLILAYCPATPEGLFLFPRHSQLFSTLGPLHRCLAPGMQALCLAPCCLQGPPLL